MSENERLLSITLEFCERIQYNERVADTHIFTRYMTFAVKQKDFKATHEDIKQEFKKICDVYE